jgi:hypothetical protein
MNSSLSIARLLHAMSPLLAHCSPTVLLQHDKLALGCRMEGNETIRRVFSSACTGATPDLD